MNNVISPRENEFAPKISERKYLKKSTLKSAKPKALRPKQLRLMKRQASDYGGDLLKTREGRSHGRPLSTRETMHLVLRSTKAKAALSFLNPKNDKNARRIFAKFAAKFGVQILSVGNAGNHFHLHIKLSNRFTYGSFIRAVTGGIAMTVMGRAGKVEPGEGGVRDGGKFWDRRPFTRIASSLKEFFYLKDYVRMNELEGQGFSRSETREMVKVEKIWNCSR